MCASMCVCGHNTVHNRYFLLTVTSDVSKTGTEVSIVLYAHAYKLLKGVCVSIQLE